MRIDDSGDRDADYSVLDLDPITGRFEEVAHYSGLTKNYTPLPGKQIHWPGGSTGPPPDVPACGFMNTDPQCTSSGDFFREKKKVPTVALFAAFKWPPRLPMSLAQMGGLGGWLKEPMKYSAADSSRRKYLFFLDGNSCFSGRDAGGERAGGCRLRAARRLRCTVPGGGQRRVGPGMCRDGVSNEITTMWREQEY